MNNHSNPFLWLAAWPAWLALAAPAFALDWHFDGYGTAGVSCLTSTAADFVINAQPRGPGRSSQCDPGLDSVLGTQLSLELHPSLSLRAQSVVERDSKDSYAPQLTVAQILWKPLDNLTLRLGRNPTALFIYSENRRLRYAMPWARPPEEVYGVLPVFSQDGGEVIYNTHLGGWAAEWHGGITTAAETFPRPNAKGTDNASSLQGFLSLTLQDADTLIKASYGLGSVSYATPPTDALFSALSTQVPGGAALAQDLALDGSLFHYAALGFRYERDDWLAMGEFGFRAIEGYTRDQTGVYFTLGKRFGPWMPYATVGRRWSSGPDSANGAGFLQPQVDLLLAATRFDDTRLSLGVSRELADRFVLKLQADWIRPDPHSWGPYTNFSPEYDYARPASNWLLTANLDFVF
jgi:hypothetical protein